MLKQQQIKQAMKAASQLTAYQVQADPPKPKMTLKEIYDQYTCNNTDSPLFPKSIYKKPRCRSNAASPIHTIKLDKVQEQFSDMHQLTQKISKRTFEKKEFAFVARPQTARKSSKSDKVNKSTQLLEFDIKKRVQEEQKLKLQRSQRINYLDDKSNYDSSLKILK